MSEPIDWLPDGTPYSPRFGDRYHSSANHGLDQARHVFLAGCGLPQAWAGQAQWRILETGFGFGLNFLVTWAAWRADPHRPRLLHFVSTEAWPVSAEDLARALTQPELAPLARELQAQWWGLLPGVHRLRFDNGQVLLTLYVGDTQAMLRQQQQNLTVDAVYLDGFSPDRNPDSWSLHTLKAIARCCRRGTRLATWTVARSVRDHLAQCGFTVERVPGVPPKRDNLHALFDPRWEPRSAPGAGAGTDTPSAALPASAATATTTTPATQRPDAPTSSPTCIVVGGGIAGAAAAASLARRGWQVVVLDRAAQPGDGGASALPAGVFAPHVSPDDSVLSRLSRSGIRATLQQAGWLLAEGVDWSPCGVLEHRTDGSAGLPAEWAGGLGDAWSQPAPDAALAQASLPRGTSACWHHTAGWVRPARLAQALVAQPGIRWQGGCTVAQLRRAAHPDAPGAADTGVPGCWQAIGPRGEVLAEAATVIIAAGAGSQELLNHRWPLRPVRGQVSWGVHGAGAAAHALPPFPVNGNGNLVPSFPVEGDSRAGSGSRGWVMGSTFERDMTELPPSAADVQCAHATNQAKLQALLPDCAAELAPAFAQALGGADGTAGAARSWAAVRCTAPDRLPIVGPVDSAALPGLWVCSAMGARGLTLALLCGELLAARLQGEPLPLDARLARALAAERLEHKGH